MGNLPGWPFVLAWFAAFFAWGFARGTPLVWPVFAAWCLLTLICLAVFVRWAVRARGWRRVVAVTAGVLVVGFIAQRLTWDSDEYEIERAIETAATSTDPDYCHDVVTEDYLTQSLGVPAPFADEACETYAAQEGADSVDVSQIDVDQDEASAAVDFWGGAFGGSRTAVALVKEDGDWKLDRTVAIPRFDRERFDYGYRESFREFGSPGRAADCAVRSLSRLTDAEIVRMTLAGETDVYERIAVRCDRPGVERAILSALKDPFYDEYPSDAIECVRRRVRNASAAELARLSAGAPAYDRLDIACDRDASYEALERELAADDEIGDETAACTVAELRQLPDREAITLVYDDRAYSDLVAGCES